MKKTVFVLLIISGIFSSCVSVNLSSNRSKDHQETIKKVFVTTQGAKSAQTFYTSLCDNLSVSLKQHGAEMKFHHFEPLSLETEADIVSKINAFQPNLIMVIQQSESTKAMGSFGMTSDIGGIFDIKIFKSDLKSIVWRGELEVKGAIAMEKSGRKANETIIERFIKEKLL